MDEYADIYYVDGSRNASEPRVTSRSVAARTPGGMPPGHPLSYSTRQPQYGYGAPPYGYGAPMMGSSALFGRMTTGEVVDMVAQIFAALMPLPVAPTATADVPTDVNNLILYQGSIAQYAKRDEQVRTLGNLITKLVG